MKDEILEQLKILFEVSDEVAGFCWNLFEKLKSKGFTDDQAIRIVVGLLKNK